MDHNIILIIEFFSSLIFLLALTFDISPLFKLSKDRIITTLGIYFGVFLFLVADILRLSSLFNH
jgi:hypothetical protein